MELILLQLLQVLFSAALLAAVWVVLVWCTTDLFAKTKKPDYYSLVLVAFHVLPLLIFVSSVRRCSFTLDDTIATVLLGECQETRRQVTVDAVPNDTVGSNNEKEPETPTSCMGVSNGDHENGLGEDDDNDDDQGNADNLRKRSEEIIKKIKRQWQQEWQTESGMHPP